jgi:hypothetical protein
MNALHSSVSGVVEHPDDLRRASRVSAKGINDWFFVGESGGIAERYCIGEAGIAFRYSWPEIGWRAKEHSFIVRAIPNEIAEGGPIAPFRNDKALDDRDQGHQLLMLPRSVEVMEGVQKFVPSAVWPQCFDCDSVCFSKPTFAFSAIYPPRRIIESFNGSEGGEMRISLGYNAVATRKGGCQKIKTAADCVDDDSRLDIEAEVGRPCPANYDEIVPRVWIRLYNDCIWARPFPGVKAFLHDWDLGFGPIDGSLST